MTTVKEIQDLKEYLVGTYHAHRLNEQQIDETYINDTFKVPFIKKGVQSAVRASALYNFEHSVVVWVFGVKNHGGNM